MRLRINLSKENFELPLAYQSILQGVIYVLLSKSSLGNKYHNEGYTYDRKKFKCFTFSSLFGTYEIKDRKIVFEKNFYFYVSSQDEQFMKSLFEVLQFNDYLLVNKTMVNIDSFSFEQLSPFSGQKTVKIKTLSPLLIYSTSNNYILVTL